MDPNLFHLDWERTCEVLAAIVVLSMFVERALAPLFEHRAFVRRYAQRGFKEPIAVAVSIAVCLYLQFDALSIVILRDRVSMPGILVTAAVVAGGSKGSIKLFHDVLNWKSTALREAKGEIAADPTVAAKG